MDVITAIKQRKSTRGFLPDLVPKETIYEILDAARWCGSFVNNQPWEFAVLSGEVMKRWKDTLWYNHLNQIREERGPIGPGPMPEINIARGDAFRSAIDNTVFPPGIDNRDERQQNYVKSGVVVRDAPNAIVLYMEEDLTKSMLSFIAAGGILQAISLAALSLGVSTCIMGKPAESPKTLRTILGLPDSKVIVSVVALGYPDMESTHNMVPRTRAEVGELTSWYGFDG